MIRRTALTTLAVAAAPILVPAALSTPARAAASLSNGEYKKMTLNYGTLALMTSMIARGRARNTDVKRFAAFEIAEQTTVAQVLTDKQNPPPAPLTDEQEAIIAQLRKLSGAAFDRQYVKVQTEGHLMLRKIQRAYIAHPDKQDLLHIAKLADTTIGEHLDHLSRLPGDL